jgi:hypothetical protein
MDMRFGTCSVRSLRGLRYVLVTSWEDNRSSVSQQISRNLWNSKILYRIHNSPPLGPILSQINPVHAPHPTSRRSILILSSHLPLGLRSGVSHQVSPPKPCMCNAPQKEFYFNPFLFILFYIFHICCMYCNERLGTSLIRTNRKAGSPTIRIATSWNYRKLSLGENKKCWLRLRSMV